MKILKFSIILLIIMTFALWFLVTQPVFIFKKENKPKLTKPQNLQRHVEKLVWEFGPRRHDRSEIEQVVQYLENQFKLYSSEVEIQEYPVQDRVFKNIIARFGDFSSQKPIILGAHYDSFEGLPGADDNASGVAALLELARILSQHPIPIPIELVAYGSEEPPYFKMEHMGSFHHAKKYKEADKGIELMISLEMLGYFSDEPNSQEYPIGILKYFYPTQGNFIVIASNWKNALSARRFKKVFKRFSQVPTYSISAPAQLPGIDFSDHLNYWSHGYPALMLTDTAFYRNKYYHTKQDTPERLDYERMAYVVDGLYYALEKFKK